MVNKENIECLILEDEYYTAFEIRRLLCAYNPAYTVAATLESCKEFTEFIDRGQNVDLIVSNINLADGMVLEPLSSMKRPIPVILTCAEYPQDFKMPNLVGCIYKPVTGELLYKCLETFEQKAESLITNS